CVCSLGAGLAVWQASASRPGETEPAKQEASKATAIEPHRRKVDRFGDQLPDGALARVGTVRFRSPSPKLQDRGDVVFLLDGKTIVSVHSSDSTVRFWDCATGKERCCINGPPGCFGVSASPDGNTLAVGGKTEVWTWDLGALPPRQRWRQQPP